MRKRRYRPLSMTPGLLLAAVVFPAIVDAATAAQRWVGAASMAQGRFAAGVQATTKDPTQLAAAQAAKMLANVTQSITSGRWARGLAAVGGSGWKAATVAKAANYSTGIQASEQKYMAAIGPVLAIEAQLQNQLAGMPKATIADSLARVNVWMTGLHNWKLSR